MTPDPVRLLEDLNPVATSTPPSIDRLWDRLATETGVPHRAGRQAAHARASSTPPGPRRRLLSGSRLLGVVTVAVVLGIVAAALLLVHPRADRPGVVAGGHGGDLVQILGVLRRPQTSADRTAERRDAGFFTPMRRAGARMTAITSGARVAGRLPGGQRVLLVPVAVHPVRSSGGRPFVGVAILSGGGGGCCSSAAEIEAGDAFTSSGDRGGNLLIVVVPDGVARVRVALPHPIGVTVHDNVAVMQPRTGVENIQQYAMTWYSRGGAVIKRFAAGRTTKPTAAEVKAAHRQALAIAERTRVRIVPSIQTVYPLFGPGFTTLRAGFGATSVVVTHPDLAELPTDALADAGTVPKYRTAPRDAREVQIRNGLHLWLEPGHKICIYAPTPRDNVCTPLSDPNAALVSQPSGQPDPKVILALVPKINATVDVITTHGSWSAPTHDGVAVVAAAHVTALRYKTSSGRTITHSTRSP